MAASQRPFDPYQAGAKVYRAYRAGGRPAPQTTLVSIPGPIPSMEVPIAPSLETVPKPVKEMQPIATPILPPKTMIRNPIKTIPNKRKQVPTLVGEIEYKVDYIIFKITESISSYPILLGRPWLYLAKTKDDWGKGTLTIGRGSQKTSLPMYPPIYRGETQEDDTNVTSDNSYDSDSEREMYEPIKHVASNSKSYRCLGLGEYFTPLVDPNDSDDAILAWQ
jgi:hypothetical protein